MSIGRNELCPCGSGLKYKRCCLVTGSVDDAKRQRTTLIAIVTVVAIALVLAFAVSGQVGAVAGALGGVGVAIWLWLSAPPPSKGGGDPGAINFGR
ncbi:MAG: SEC-C domain-containing protein [Acidobacteriota bacterium]